MDELAEKNQELRNAHLQLRTLTEQVRRLSRQLIEAQESERRRLSRELHDRVGQNLTALALNLNMIRNDLLPRADAEVSRRLEDCLALVSSTADAIDRALADLHTPILDAEGLLPALLWHSGEFSERTGIEVQVRGAAPESRPARHIEIALFRIAQEALNNAAKHAQTAQVQIELSQSDSELALRIADDGVGFDSTGMAANWKRRRGMQTMRERAEAIGGILDVRTGPGNGTQVTVRVPLRALTDEE
jgi:signal transduction histidine kinase